MRKAEMVVRNDTEAPAADAAFVDALLAHAAGRSVRIAQEGHPLLIEPHPERVKAWREWLEIAVESRDKATAALFRINDKDPAAMSVSPIPKLKHRAVIVPTKRGRGVKWLRELAKGEDALRFAATLLLNPDLPYGDKLAMCHLPSCGKIYLSRQHPAGGPANKVYCKGEHREEASDKKLNRRKK